jgi:hypothetical protein
MTGSGLRNPAELAARLALADPGEVLLIDVPEALERLIDSSRPADRAATTVESRSLRSVKQKFAAVLLWRENRIGSQAVLDAAVRRLASEGVLWVVVAMRKVTGPDTPAAHRLDVKDLRKALAPAGLSEDREVRVSAWHVAYRFRARDAPEIGVG